MEYRTFVFVPESESTMSSDGCNLCVATNLYARQLERELRALNREVNQFKETNFATLQDCKRETISLDLQIMNLKRDLAAKSRECDRFIALLHDRSTKTSAQSTTKSAVQDCVVCLGRPAELAMIPCGHLCLCRSCMHQTAPKQCPICRDDVRMVCKIYFWFTLLTYLVTILILIWYRVLG